MGCAEGIVHKDVGIGSQLQADTGPLARRQCRGAAGWDPQATSSTTTCHRGHQNHSNSCQTGNSLLGAPGQGTWRCSCLLMETLAAGLVTWADHGGTAPTSLLMMSHSPAQGGHPTFFANSGSFLVSSL